MNTAATEFEGRAFEDTHSYEHRRAVISSVVGNQAVAVTSEAHEDAVNDSSSREPEVYPLPDCHLSSREKEMLARLITTVPAGEWFRRSGVDMDGISFGSRGAFGNAYAVFIRKLTAAGITEHNGKPSSNSGHKLTRAFMPPDIEKSANRPKQVPSTTPSPTDQYQSETRPRTPLEEYEAREARRQRHGRRHGESSKKRPDKQVGSKTLEQKLEKFLAGETDFPEDLAEADRFKIRVFLGGASTMKHDIPGYHMRHRQLQVWLNPQLAEVIDVETGKISRPPN